MDWPQKEVFKHSTSFNWPTTDKQNKNRFRGF